MDDWAYMADLQYEVWCAGGRMDAVDPIRAAQYQARGLTDYQAADIEVALQRKYGLID